MSQFHEIRQVNEDFKEISMDEELLEGILKMIGEGMLAGEDVKNALEMVEDDNGVIEMAKAPEPKSGSFLNFFKNNKYGKTLWTFSKEFGKEGIKMGVLLGIMYGMNKAMATDAKKTGKRKCLTSYLDGVEKTYQKINLTFSKKEKQKAADDALDYPWIDCTC
jgi:hypothetical protein